LNPQPVKINDVAAERNRRILVIDDNRAIHDDFRKIFCPDSIAAAALDKTATELFGKPAGAVRRIRYEIDSAYQGQDGVRLVEKALEKGIPYAMAFVDVRMPPGWDGVETTQRILAIDPDIQIVICTAYADYSWEEMFEKIGNRDGLLILKKPFDTVEALQLAHALTEKWWLHQQSRQKMEELESRVAGRTRELEWKTAFLEAQVNSSLDGILVVDQDQNTALQNQRFVDLFKIPRRISEEKSDKNRLQWVTDSIKNPEPFVQKVLHLYAHQSEISRDEIELKDGTILDRYTSPVVGQDDKYYGRIWSFRDITERKRMEEALRASEQKFQGLFKNSRDALIIAELPSGMFTSGNPAALKIFGAKSEEEFILHGLMDLSPDYQPEGRVSAEKAREMIETALREGSHYFEWTHRRLDGEEFPADVLIARMEQEGKVVLQGTVRDITARKRTEEALHKIKLQLVHAMSLAQLVAWEYDVASGLFNFSDTYYALHGTNAELENGNLMSAEVFTRKFMHPDDAHLVADSIGRAMATADPDYHAQQEARILRRDGEVRHVLVNMTITKDAAGRTIQIQGANQDITERKRIEEALRTSQQLLERIINAISVRVFWKDKNLVYLGCNAVFARDAGFADPKDLIGKDDTQMGWRVQAEKYRADDRQVIESGCSKLLIEEPQTTPDGKTITLLSSKMPLRGSTGEISGVLGTYMDITERKRLETQVFQSQKMETVGKLAGGIAHEFNSILTAIIGQSELLLSDLPPGSPLCKNAAEISKAADRAATLTRQLLAYGRKQMLQPEALDLDSIVAGMAGTLRHLLGGGTDLHIAACAGLKAVKADAGQIEQVIMNMVLNARDAMPHGGKLTLETANVSFDPETVGRYPELKPGEYVMLAITDTGAGMSEAVKARVFEPFFTTKGIGQGTGLGLSTCYGIIKQSGGHISVYSEPGRGATFKIYLPQVEAQTKIPFRRPVSPALPTGTETILLVEDDPALREMAAALLKRLGYTVLAAANGIEALSLKQRHDTGHIDLLFTDVVMPHMSGKELADRVRSLYPHTRILFTSAYTENAIVHQGVLEKGVALLQKPFTPSALAHKLREVLDQPGIQKPDSAQTTFGFTKIADGLIPPIAPADMTPEADFAHG
jgi:PAS domain S-box-containing protein